MLPRMQMTPDMVRMFGLKPYRLSDREIAVLGLLLGDYTNKQVAERLGISARTVEVHRAHILAKTKASGLVGLAKLAMDLGASTGERMTLDASAVRDAARVERLAGLSADIVASYVSRNDIDALHVPELIGKIHETMTGLGSKAARDDKGQPPAVPVGMSIMTDVIICLEEGKKCRSLKRHLAMAHGLTPEAYRAKWSLPGDYPMAAPSYSQTRARLARKHGLGKKHRTEADVRSGTKDRRTK